MKSFLAAATLLVAGVAATNHEAGAPGQQMVHVVEVGGNMLNTFNPPNTIAAVGDIVQFQFLTKNHSVVQSTFDKPCIPLAESLPERQDGFFSGFMPAASAPEGQRLVYSVEVKSEDTMWFYCSQGTHCTGGMVGAVNAKTEGDKTVEAHVGLAAAFGAEGKNPTKPAEGGWGAGNPYYPVGTGVPPPYYPTGSGAPPAPTGAPTTFVPGTPSPTEGADLPQQSDNAASTLKQGLTGFAGLIVAAFMAL